MASLPRRTTTFVLLVAPAILAAGIACWTAWRAAASQRQIVGNESETYRHVESECREISNHTLESVHRLNAYLLRWLTQGDTSGLANYRAEDRHFAEWFTTRRETVTPGKLIITNPAKVTIHVPSLLDEVRQAYDEYHTAAETTVRTRALPDYEAAQRATQRLILLAGKAEQQAAAVHVVQTIRSVSYRHFITVVALVITGLALWLIFVVHRALLLPMHRELAQATALVEKQQKFAHFAELAAGLAHEIRNPLTAINARLYTLQKSLRSNAAAAEDAGVIHGEIDRLDRILNDFLKLARPAEPQLSSLNARALLEEVTRLLAPELRKNKIEIELDAIVETPFRADPLQLKQVLINLVQNAAEAIGSDGLITLSARFALQKLRGVSQEVIILEVRDTGPGIPLDVQDHLFDPFFSTKEEGTGLGLPISARIVAQHCGALEFHTQLGRGTTFGIVLPVAGKTNES